MVTHHKLYCSFELVGQEHQIVMPDELRFDQTRGLIKHLEQLDLRPKLFKVSKSH